MSRTREIFEEDEKRKRLKREIDDTKSSMVASNSCYNMMGVVGPTPTRTPTPPPLGTALNTITPCAACKLLRRRCAEECPFSPYFSPHEPQKFAAVHKVFGASNVSKLLMEVPENQRADAANSLVYEANVRLRDPIYGSMGAISTLQQHVQTLQAQLNAIRAQIIKYKYTEAANNLISAPNNNQTNNNLPHHGGHPNNSLVTSMAAAVIAATLPPQVQSPPHLKPTPLPPPSTPPSLLCPVAVLSSSYTPPLPPPPPPPPPPDSGIANNGFTSISNDHNVQFFD